MAQRIHPQPTATEPATEALAALAEYLPRFGILTDERTRGRGCIWCGTHLTAETAIDLGERAADDGTVWFPRGCRPCTLKRTHRVLQYHSGACEQCVDDHTQCPTGVGLVRLVREARR